MKRYAVTMPIAGAVYVEVEAEDEEAALEAAWDSFDSETPEPEWGYYEHIVEGNVCNVPDVDVTVEEIEDLG